MRDVICADADEWLDGKGNLGAVVTSLPDAAEIGGGLNEWETWFVRLAERCMRVASPDAPSVFYQTDRKGDGVLHSKASLLFRAAQAAGVNALWHKIALRRSVGAVDLHRPGYTHLIAFSRDANPGRASPDVFDAGRMIYPNAMGLAAAGVAVRFAALSSTTIVDPFCGRGTVLAIANALGLNAVGVDIDPQQVAYAQRLEIQTTRELARALAR